MNTIPLKTRAPQVRHVNSREELRRTLVADMAELREAGPPWVRATAMAAHEEILGAGNPQPHLQEINGRNGKGFHRGPINQAFNSARVQYVGSDLAFVCNRVHMMLLSIIWKSFPRMRRKRITHWSWYVARKALDDPSTATLVHAGRTVPRDLDIDDVCILAPDAEAAEYAWFANSYARKNRSYQSKRKRRKDAVNDRRTRGFLAETTARLRGVRLRSYQAGFSIQARIIGSGLTSSKSRAVKVGKLPHALPIIRVAHRKALTTQIWWTK